MPRKYTDVDGVAVHYFHTGATTLPDRVPPLGQGELLLFLHDAGGNGNLFRHQLDYFGGRHSAVAPDLPGHGRSGATEGLGTFDAHVAFVSSFADRLALRPFVFVGVGLGGAVALEYALRHPERVRGLVLVATPCRFEVPKEDLETWRDVTRGRRTQPFSAALFSPQTEATVMREVWMEQVKTDPRVRHTDLLACDGIDFSGRLRALAKPALVIAGEDDRVAPPAEAERLANEMRGAKLDVLAGAGHMATIERPQAFNEAVDDFLAALAG
jgi:3-oxoadipate enol-lactonase